MEGGVEKRQDRCGRSSAWRLVRGAEAAFLPSSATKGRGMTPLDRQL
jgi:hypothetical protein